MCLKEFASSNPRSLSGHGEVASALVGMQMSTHGLFVDIRDFYTYEGLRVLREISQVAFKTKGNKLQKQLNLKVELVSKLDIPI